MSRPLYRSRDRAIFGVCAGVAEYFDLSVQWLRMLTFFVFVFTGFVPTAIVYMVIALVLKPSPVEGYGMGSSYSGPRTGPSSKSQALQRLKDKLEGLEQRTRRMESVVTDREFDWERRFRAGQ